MSQILLGNAPLGQGQGGGVGTKDRFGNPPYYLVNDTFTTTRSAGAVNGTRAEPGPGVRDVNDTGSKLSLSGGSLVIATAAPGTGNPRLLYATQGRRAGLVAVAALTTPGSGTAGPARAGWTYSPTGIYGTEAVAFNSSNVLEARVNLTNVTVGASALGTAYTVAVVLRASGAYYFIKGGTFTNWTLLWVSTGVTDTPMAPVVAAINNGAGCSCPYVRVPATPWLPTPLASDGFGSAFGTSDGLGHAEGVNGGIGSGGSGLSWTQDVGTWTIFSAGAKPATVVSSRAIATVNTSKADVVVSASHTSSGGSGGIIARYVDSSNYIRLTYNGANLILTKRLAGTDTDLFTTAATYVAGAPITLVCEGTKFRAFYNNVAVGAEQTIADAALQSGTRQGLTSTNTVNVFDNFTVYSRGTGGEYAALDAF